MRLTNAVPALLYGYSGSAPGYYYESSGASIEQSGLIGVIVVAVIALIIAFAVVSSMKRKLLTAKSRADAADYVRPNSLNLTVREDRFLYQTEQRRRIEQNRPQGPNRGPMQKGR